MKISKIIIYDEPTVPEIQLKKLSEFLNETFPIQVELQKNFLEISDDDIFEKIATTKINDLKKPFKKHIPTQEDIFIEKQSKDISEDEITYYDGFELCKIINEFIPRNENKIDTLHIIFSNKLTCTFDEKDFRYHARALIGSNPTIISTTGIIEAPAKPKKYYLELMTSTSQKETDDIKEKYQDEFLKYHDSQISQIVEGYLLQAIMYYETGEAFCEQKDCRLFNAHWQKELLFTQLESKKLCEKHIEIIKKMNDIGS